ncbi:MAG: methylmalonyl-CoA mutase [Chloroflexi bacterium]|nr:methylmalonyl-CoA mutase [Chloroflexota bacterium]
MAITSRVGTGAGAHDRWKAKVGSRPVKPARTDAGLDVKLLYTPEDVAWNDYLGDLGFPGEYPYTRGIYPTMYRGNLWTMREYAGFGTADDTNAHFKYLLSQGATGLSVALDLPTQLGLDPDHPAVEDEVGRVGVAISTLQDMEDIFAGIPLDRVSTSFTINATSAELLAMYVAAGEKQGVDAGALRGTLQNDILKEYLARGTWIYPVAPSLRVTGDVIAYCATNVPKFNSISVSAAHLRQSGANAVESLGLTFANAMEYIRATLDRGLNIDEFAPRLSFNLGLVSSDFFEEVAKFRAARRLWAKLMRERWGAQDPKSWTLRFYSGCGGDTLQKQEPLNNVIRVAYEALSAALGGAQAIFTCSYDEAYAIPTEESVRLALRTQQILAYETGVANTADPLGGSYFVESLTNEIERAISQVMADVDAQGGIIRAIESGYLQRRLAKGAYEDERRIASGEKIVVGVNRFRSSTPPEPIQTHQHDPRTTDRQRERVRRVKAGRDENDVERSLARLADAARGDDNVVPAIVEAVLVFATIGEISHTLRGVFGEFREPVGV